MHIGRDELHQVLVGGDDGDIRTDCFRLAGIGGDDVVGLEPFGLDAGKIEGAGRVADQTELRNEIFRRRRAIGLVEVVQLVAEGLGGIVEDHREMRWRHPHIGVARILQQLPQHVAEAGHGVDRQSIGFAVERRDGMEGAENETGAVHEEEMIAFFHGKHG